VSRVDVILAQIPIVGVSLRAARAAVARIDPGSGARLIVRQSGDSRWVAYVGHTNPDATNLARILKLEIADAFRPLIKGLS
jgi:hypothetical protein